ncbi:MAG: putative damage-inducible protein DinB [Planctomycetota bacterium]|jgi:uncharacterized damage-inducible protein DinB
MSLAELFLSDSCTYLRETYPGRLERALEVLPPADLWWRPHFDCISFGTILTHLEGNVRQWILSGLGGESDRRERELEFSATTGPDGTDLMQRLRSTAEAASDVIAVLDEVQLARPITIQGFQTTVLAAVMHVVEHFSWHTGQAVWIAKMRAGAGHEMAFFDEDAVNSARNAGE